MKGLLNDNLIYVEGYRRQKSSADFMTAAEFKEERLKPEFNDSFSAGDHEHDFKEKS